MTVELFAGISVRDFEAALPWYKKLLGEPSFLPNDIEAVWEVAEHRYVYIEEVPEHAGHAQLLVFVDDLDTRLASLSEQGIEPTKHENFNGVRKITFHDPDGNEFGFGSRPPPA